jgi:RNA polymerase sigma-70 factor (ECF subfamily)
MAEQRSRFHTRPSLLLRLRDAGDQEAWGLFVDVYGPLVYHRCRARGLGHQDAEDVTQQVFAEVVRSIRSFTYRPEVGRFRDWLRVVADHRLGRHFRQAAGRTPVADEGVLLAAEARGEDTAWTAEFRARLLQVALARCRPHFAPDTWRAFELVWLENRPAAEVGRELGQPVEWVYVAKSRVLSRLSQEVRDLADDTALL